MAKIRISPETKKKISNAFDQINVEDTKIPSFYSNVLNFQGKKSYSVAQKILSYICDGNSQIYDPFFGTGAFLIAASKSGNHVVGTDIDNYVFNAVKILLSKCNMNALNMHFETVKNSCKKSVMFLYETSCCGHKNYISKLHFDPSTNEFFNPTPHRDIKDGRNVILLSKCPVCKNKTKKFEASDLAKIQYIDSLDVSRFPNHKFIENSRINITSDTGADRYDTNFTNRSKVALLKIQDAILTLPDCIERDIIEYALVFSIALSKIAMYGSGTNNLYHVINYTAQEMNVWDLFESKFDAIKKYKRELSFVLQDAFTENEKIELYNQDYVSYLNNSNKKFDVIYTDPPYTDQVPYLEYQQYYRDWLRIFYDREKYQLSNKMLQDEIVVTNAPSRSGKDLDNYFKDIDLMFNMFSDHLVDNGLLFMTIKLGEKKYFTVLTKYIELARKNGLEFVSKYSIKNNDPTIRKQAAYINTLSTQIVVAFQKVDKENRYWYIKDLNVEKKIIEITYTSISRSSNHYILLSTLMQSIKNYFFTNYAINFTVEDLNRTKEIIKENFVIDSVSNVQIDPNEFYAGLEDESSMFIKLYDTIPVLIKKLLGATGKFTLDDLYYEIANLLCEYDPALFDVFLRNDNYKSSIKALLDNYCEESNNVYVQRRISNTQQEGSVDISCLDGYEFENLIKKLLKSKGYTNVTRIGGAGDRGVDLIATSPEPGNMKVIFQCKRWISNVGSEPIQRLHSMMTLDSKSVKDAVCITTSDYTTEGKEVAKLTGVKIINGIELLKDLEYYYPNHYYHGALKIQS